MGVHPPKHSSSSRSDDNREPSARLSARPSRARAAAGFPSGSASAAPDSDGSTHQSVDSPAANRVKRSRPSDNQPGCPAAAASFVAWVSAPVRRSSRKICVVPARVDAKAMPVSVGAPRRLDVGLAVRGAGHRCRRRARRRRRDEQVRASIRRRDEREAIARRRPGRARLDAPAEAEASRRSAARDSPATSARRTRAARRSRRSRTRATLHRRRAPAGSRSRRVVVSRCSAPPTTVGIEYSSPFPSRVLTNTIAAAATVGCASSAGDVVRRISSRPSSATL